MDTVLDKSLNVNSLSENENKPSCLLEGVRLVDVWRLRHPKVRDNTYFLPVHLSHTRLDYFLTSQSLVTACLAVEIYNISISDYYPIKVEIGLNHCIKKKWKLEA